MLAQHMQVSGHSSAVHLHLQMSQSALPQKDPEVNEKPAAEVCPYIYMLMCVHLPVHMCNRHPAEENVDCRTIVCLGKAQESLGFMILNGFSCGHP